MRTLWEDRKKRRLVIVLGIAIVSIAVGISLFSLPRVCCCRLDEGREPTDLCAMVWVKCSDGWIRQPLSECR